MPDYINHDQNRIYASNLNALKERYPDIYKNFLTVNQDTLINTVKLHPDNRLPDIMLKDHHRKVFYYGHDDPMAYCSDYLATLDLHYAPVLVFMGFGLGYQVASAVNDLAKGLDIKHIIIIEEDIELFRAAMATMDFSEIIKHPNVEFIVGTTHDGVFNALCEYYKRCPMVTHHFRSLKIVVMPSVLQICGGYYEKAVEILKKSIMIILQQLGNDPYDSICGVNYTLQNIKPIIEDPWIISFKNAFKGRPAILVGAGPSLNKDIDLLKEASHKALLVCVDAALKPLLDRGIEPQIVTNVERSKGQSGFFAGLEELENTYFVYCSVVYPDTYESYKGPKIITHRYPEIMEWLGLDTGIIKAGPLVGNYAFNIAEYFGCDPIIMLGQDLSIPRTGATHVEGMVFGTIEQYRDNMLEIEGSTGETLLTTRDFDESRLSLEEQIEAYDALCINATPGGAKINGTLLMDFKSATEKYCVDSYDFLGSIGEIWTKEKNTKHNKKSELNRILTVLDQSLSELNDALNRCKKGKKLIADFEANYDLLIDKRPNPEIIDKIRRLDRKITDIREDILLRPTLHFMVTTFGGYYTNFCMRKNYVYDQFHDRSFAALKAFLMEKESLTITGQLILSTIYLIQEFVNGMQKEQI